MEYILKENQIINSFQIIFDTNLNTAHVSMPGLFKAKECVKDYRIKFIHNNQIIKNIEISDNYQRLRVHKFEAIKVSKI